jgi:peptidylprolyl isomerase
MNKSLVAAALVALALSAPPVSGQASASIAAGKTQPSPLAPSEIVGNAPKADWTGIAASDLLVMDLSPDAKGKPRRVVIQLMPPPFSQGWIGNIRKLAAAKFWDGTSVNRVQDNYVVQWGDPEGEDKAKAKALPDRLAVVPQNEYAVENRDMKDSLRIPLARAKMSQIVNAVSAVASKAAKTGKKEVAYLPMPTDFYADGATHWNGWPIASSEDNQAAWPVHCYAMVGVGRDMPPNTGSGAELYAVIGHAPRHLDRNIALVGRVIEGIEHLSSLPRGSGALGFYETPEERVPIQSVRIGSEVKDLPAYEFLSTESESFAAYADARANRRDAFFIRPAGGADICNIPVPVRRAK